MRWRGVNNGVKHDHATRDMNHNGVPSLSPSEISDLNALVAKWIEPSDELSRYLVGKFSEATRQLLSAYSPDGADSQALRSAVAKELAGVIERESIFETNRFAGIALSTKTQKYVGRQLEGSSLASFNRLLLEDAYPQAIAKRKNQRPKQKTVRVGIGLFRIVGVQGIYGKKNPR
jgi:hypothetical protein